MVRPPVLDVIYRSRRQRIPYILSRSQAGAEFEADATRTFPVLFLKDFLLVEYLAVFPASGRAGDRPW